MLPSVMLSTVFYLFFNTGQEHSQSPGIVDYEVGKISA